MKRVASVGAGLAAVAVLALTGAGASGPAVAFGKPVKVTPDLAGGYEPSVVVDRFGNIFATAHKENWQLVLSPDSQSPTMTRSMSWDWVSVDGGKTFKEIPGYPLNAENHDFGDEGDMALDDAGHLYFVDTNVVDDTITRWTVTGLDKISIDFHRPVIPAAEPVDDRPWVTAHGNGSVFYFGNQGDKVTYPLGHGAGGGFGPGRYTVYQSYDGGQTFDAQGYTLKDSGWCRPAADHAPGSKYVYALCTNDGGSNDFSPMSETSDTGTLWAYVSADDGRTFERYAMGPYKAKDPTTSWPSVTVAPDGSIWALYVDAARLDRSDSLTGTSYATMSNSLRLLHSTDHGRTWTSQEITPRAGRYRYAWLSVSPDGGALGLGVYYRPNPQTPWRVYGSMWKPGEVPVLTSLDEANPVAPASVASPPGDYLGSAFGPDGRLSVVWTRIATRVPTVGNVLRDIYYARSLSAFGPAKAKVLPKKVTRPRAKPAPDVLPATGLADAPRVLWAMLLAAAALVGRSLRRAR